MSNFAFLAVEWPEVHESAKQAEAFAQTDARTTCFYARRALELAVNWMYQNDGSFKAPYQGHLNALIHEPTFQATVGPAIFAKTKLLKDLGNLAVHSTRPLQSQDALMAVRELFHMGYWLARTYARQDQPGNGLTFDAALLPPPSRSPARTLAQLQEMDRQLAEKDRALAQALADKESLDEELARLRQEVAQAKARNAAQVDTHDYSEAQTRDYFIDLLLKEAGWPLEPGRDLEYPVQGMPNTTGAGFVDYVLWGDDGKPLAVVEAKRARRDSRDGMHQARLYADCLEQQFGRRPVIFTSNGYEHWFWDDQSHPPRQVQGFYKKTELELLHLRRETRKLLDGAEINEEIVDRYYQKRAIRKICETFERDHLRRALVVMATGAGKTRTVVALCDLLMRCNWVKRVLFLADRKELVNQAVNAFKKHLPGTPPVNLLTEKETDGRVFVSTYPTMMGLIDSARDGQKQFGVGHFDLIVIDEAHRSIYKRYGAIFDYFDALLVGLTATPRDEIDRNTYSLFNLEAGVPTDEYGLNAAVDDKFLVPPEPLSVPLQFQREGIRYDDLSDDEKEDWESIEWSEEDDEPPPREVGAAALNLWLFNADTVDKVLEDLMKRGQKVAGGDRLGKTIIFAKNHNHAMFIKERFDANYPEYRGEFAQVIDVQVSYAEKLIEKFKIPESGPHLAISVDMMDTGIDVPEVVNLVFFKLVRSRTKFWQMVGRGTRLSPNLFGPDEDKKFFYVLDYCQNLEFFIANLDRKEGTLGESLGSRLFSARLELVSELDRQVQRVGGNQGVPCPETQLRQETAERLREEVAGMNLENFLVRPHRRLVEEFSQPEAWGTLTSEQLGALDRELAGLPSQVLDNDEQAKRFDLLMLRLQLCVLRAERGFERLRDQVRVIASNLEEKSNIPMVRAELELIEEIQAEEYWQDVTTPMLETIRRRLRALVKFVEKASRKPLYTNFQDTLGEAQAVDLLSLASSGDFERFRAKARHFLNEHANHVTIHKLRWNLPLTGSDLAELERFMVEAGVGDAADFERARQESEGLGLFVRSLVGLDREAAKQEFSAFLSGKAHTSSQIEFLNLVIDHLTEHGVMDPALLYESPYTDINPRGPEGVFGPSQVGQIVETLQEIRRRAAG